MKLKPRKWAPVYILSIYSEEGKPVSTTMIGIAEKPTYNTLQKCVDLVKKHVAEGNKMPWPAKATNHRDARSSVMIDNKGNILR